MSKIIIILTILGFLVSCEDVVQIDVPNDKTRLSLDALIRITEDMAPTVEIKVFANETTSFFKDIGPADLDAIFLTNESTNNSIALSESFPGSGEYTAEWPLNNLLEGTLLLTIEHKNEQYEARTSYIPAVPIDGLIQGDGTLFSDEETEVKISFTDEPNREDFYLFDFNFGEFLVSEDTFYPGQSFEFSFFYEDGIEPGRELTISILGVSEPFFNYMNQLIIQSGGDQGPFQTPISTVKGNIVNMTNPDNFALGYFAICQSFSDSIIIE